MLKVAQSEAKKLLFLDLMSKMSRSRHLVDCTERFL